MFRISKNLFSLKLARCFYSTDVGTLHGTLHERFFLHIKQNRGGSRVSPLIDLFQGFPVDPNMDQKKRIKRIDNECVKEIRKKTTRSFDCYGLVDGMVEAVPAEVTRMNFFPEAIKILIGNFERSPTKEKFVKLCFYLGLLKKKPPGPILLENITEVHFDKIVAELDTTDLAIICTATYKAGVKIKSKKFADRLIKEIKETEEIDSHIFTAFMKSLRLNEIYARKVTDRIRLMGKQGDLKTLPIQCLVHVFPYIADNSIRDFELAKYFADAANELFVKGTRAKDIQKLIYSCALLNYPVELKQLQKMESLLIECTLLREFELKFDYFVDAALSMWMLNYRARNLIDILLKDPRFYISGDQNRIKLDSRKKLLLTCIEIEEPTWIKKMHIVENPSFNDERPPPSFLIKPTLEKAITQFQNAKFVQQILNLNIAGILVTEEDGRKVHVEVLDKATVLSDKESPNGIFALKLRLLKQLNCEVKLVRKFFHFL
jgi:hypothetical protein